MNKQEKIKYYQRCIDAYANRPNIARVTNLAIGRKIRWYKSAIKRENQSD